MAQWRGTVAQWRGTGGALEVRLWRIVIYEIGGTGWRKWENLDGALAEAGME